MAADPVDFKEMAAEQHRCPETQWIARRHTPKICF
jgi:hypothetical protein